MTVSRVSDAQSFTFLVQRSGALQVALQTLQEEIASGRKLLTPDQDPFGSAQAVRSTGTIASLAQFDQSSRFGTEVLASQDKALGEADNILVRAEEIATQFSSSIVSPQQKIAAAEEVHGLLQGLTAVANTELAGRRLYNGLALDAPPPYEDPNFTGPPPYDPSTAYPNPSTVPPVVAAPNFSVKIGTSSAERVRITTNLDANGKGLFTDSLVALSNLETALRTNTNINGQLTTLTSARNGLGGERASVGARQAQLVDRTSQVGGLTLQEQKTLAGVQDADLTDVISRLAQTQAALQATLVVGKQISDTSLVNLLRL